MNFSQVLDLGRSQRSHANRLVNLHRRLGRWESHRVYLADCACHKFVPKGLRLGIRPQSREEERWRVHAEAKRVVAASKAARRTFFRLRGEIGDIYIRLQEACSAAHLAIVMDAAHRIYRSTLHESNRTKGRKFAGLLKESPLVFFSRRPSVPPPDTTQTVVNLTASPLPENEKLVLSLGGKHSVPPNRFPAAELAARGQYVSEVAQKRAEELGVTGEQIAEFHNRAAELVAQSAKLPLPPLPPAIKRGLQSLKNGDRVVVPADKARALVVLERADYVAAVLRTLQTPIYQEQRRDPAPAYTTKLKEALLTAFTRPKEPGNSDRRDYELKEADFYKYRAYERLQRTHGRCGAYYGLIKTHKYDGPPRTEEERLHWLSTLKLRPICPGYRSCDYELSRHLNGILQLLPRPPLSIGRPAQVLEQLEEFDYAAGSCRLLSLDVEAMFPSIPVGKAIPLIRDLLHEHADLLQDSDTYLAPDQMADLLELSILNTHAVFNDGEKDRYWVQKRGLGMGKSHSPEVATHYMGSWESDLKELAVEAGGSVVFALRYADDYLVAFRGADDAVYRWLDLLNAKEEAIKVALEMEVDGHIAFLDIDIQRRPGKFLTKVFRKHCNTGQVVPFSSFTDPNFQNAIAADVVRALRYCQDEGSRKSELRFVQTKFGAYGYPASFVAAVVTNTIQAQQLKARAIAVPEEQKVVQPRVAVPYFGSGFHALRHEAAKLGVLVVAKPTHTLASLLCSRVKHKLPHEQMVDVVYHIKCSCGQIYIGESERELQKRTKEHSTNRLKGDLSKPFGGHKHCDPGPDFTPANVEILATEPNHRLRLLMESAMIRSRGGRETIIRSPNDISLNRNSGTLISERWLPLLRALPPPNTPI